MDVLKENIKRIMFLMEVKDSVEIEDIELDNEEVNEETELDEEEVNEEGDAPTDTTTDTSSDTGASITPWGSGAGRGPGNPITSAKREDKTGRGKGNMLGKGGEKWASGRTMGPTGNNYKV
jgi:hypothetical protein